MSWTESSLKTQTHKHLLVFRYPQLTTLPQPKPIRVISGRAPKHPQRTSLCFSHTQTDKKKWLQSQWECTVSASMGLRQGQPFLSRQLAFWVFVPDPLLLSPHLRFPTSLGMCGSAVPTPQSSLFYANRAEETSLLSLWLLMVFFSSCSISFYSLTATILLNFCSLKCFPGTQLPKLLNLGYSVRLYSFCFGS